ncbi:MAG: Crp/Fnr family transcriptional regulator [Clostridiales bacterium]|nr:Crp/Fnr family transcriptional regulator [Clostridiales bacterium]
MEKYIHVLKKTQLFAGLDGDDIKEMLHCLQARLVAFKKGEYVYRQGEHVDTISLLVSGSLHIQKEDYWGNLSIVNRVGIGEMFGEAYVGYGGGLLNDVVAIEDSVVLLFDVKKIFSACVSACKYHLIVVQNMFFAIAEKNRRLVQKLGHMSNRTTRQKLMSYLSEQAAQHHSDSFTIPFNRQQLADFLAVDRSAMSSELCKMRNDGLIQFNKNSFTLL